VNTETNTNLATSNLPLLLKNLVKQQGDYGVGILNIVEHYIKQCCKTYFSITYEEKQEISQEAAIRLLLHYDDLEHSISKRWIYVMVKNLCLDVLKKQRNHNQPTPSTSHEEADIYHQLVSQNLYNLSNFDHHQCLDNVFAYIEVQPTGPEDLMIYSHFAYGSSRADIAYITGRTVSAITKRISILRSRLKTLREELC